MTSQLKFLLTADLHPIHLPHPSSKSPPEVRLAWLRQEQSATKRQAGTE